mgnify:FL=1
MTNKDLIEMLKHSNVDNYSAPFAKDYISWSILGKDLENRLIFISVVENSDDGITMEECHTNENYWSANYPISLNYYPYNNCKIYKDIDYNSFYFIYTEWGGHSPEKRCRLIQEKLIVT